MSIRASLLTYFEKHVGQIVSLKDLVDATGLTPAQVQNNLRNLHNDPSDLGLDMKQSLKVVTRGQQWLWRPVMATNATPPGEATPRCFEEIGKTISGDVLVRCEDGTIWKVVAL